MDINLGWDIFQPTMASPSLIPVGTRPSGLGLGSIWSFRQGRGWWLFWWAQKVLQGSVGQFDCSCAGGRNDYVLKEKPLWKFQV